MPGPRTACPVVGKPCEGKHGLRRLVGHCSGYGPGSDSARPTWAPGRLLPQAAEPLPGPVRLRLDCRLFGPHSRSRRFPRSNPLGKPSTHADTSIWGLNRGSSPPTRCRCVDRPRLGSSPAVETSPWFIPKFWNGPRGPSPALPQRAAPLRRLRSSGPVRGTKTRTSGPCRKFENAHQSASQPDLRTACCADCAARPAAGGKGAPVACTRKAEGAPADRCAMVGAGHCVVCAGSAGAPFPSRLKVCAPHRTTGEKTCQSLRTANQKRCTTSTARSAQLHQVTRGPTAHPGWCAFSGLTWRCAEGPPVPLQADLPPRPTPTGPTVHGAMHSPRARSQASVWLLAAADLTVGADCARRCLAHSCSQARCGPGRLPARFRANRTRDLRDPPTRYDQCPREPRVRVNWLPVTSGTAFQGFFRNGCSPALS